MSAKNQVDTNSARPELHRAEELDELLTAVRGLILPFIQRADDAAAHIGEASQEQSSGSDGAVLLDHGTPLELKSKLGLVLPRQGRGKEGLLTTIEKILQYSVNTWDQGFLDKLYASNNPVGVISDIVLSVLNTNVHVYQVSPALTIVEKTTSESLAKLFGFAGSHAGGFTCQGGSSSNLTSMIIARNTLFPDCLSSGSKNFDFVLFTSAHGHYSVLKGAMIMGLARDSVWTVPVDEEGRMKPDALAQRIVEAKAKHKVPFYVNATAGTTVLGSFDPFEQISQICKEHNLWLHIDGSWGGSVVFSSSQRWKLKGSHLADSITMNPHKMMNVPVTCSFLLGPDVGIFHRANRTSAGYLFHEDGTDDEVWDMADMTLQCGRRADSLKLAIAWIYYGAEGFEKQIDHAFRMATYLWQLVDKSDNFMAISSAPPPNLQVCFYHAPKGEISHDPEVNTQRTRTMAAELMKKGFMVDYSPSERGSFLRVVVNVQTFPSTVEKLIQVLDEWALSVK